MAAVRGQLDMHVGEAGHLFELAQRYGFRKFIIVVPSVAIREGVLKSLEVMGDHFRSLYDAMPFNFDVYDSKHPSRVRQFAGGQHLQFLVMKHQQPLLVMVVA